jgi:branched-chain amino acid aminotransferase
LAPLATERGESGPLLVVAVMPITRPTLPLRLVTVPWPRNERGATAGVKTTSYAENVVALAYAHEHGGDEAVFLNTLGNVCEGTGSNLFVGIEGRLFTPPLSAGCLAGITRELLLEWVSTIEERDLSADVLRRADEVFITSSTRDVLAASAVDGRGLPAPGPLTRAAAEVFRERSTADPDP